MTASEHTELLPDLIRDLCGDEVNGGFIRDLCFTVWSKCHNPTHEDGNTDWGNDTLPTVQEGVKRIREKLVAFSESATDGAEPVPVAWPESWALVPREPTEAMLLTQGRSRPDLAPNEKVAASARALNEEVRRMAASIYREMIAAAPFASPTGMGVTEERQVKPLDDAEIMALIRECFPWRDHGRLYDALTSESTPDGLFPQATVTVPNYLAERFVRAIEARVTAALHPTSETTEVGNAR